MKKRNTKKIILSVLCTNSFRPIKTHSGEIRNYFNRTFLQNDIYIVGKKIRTLKLSLFNNGTLDYFFKIDNSLSMSIYFYGKEFVLNKAKSNTGVFCVLFICGIFFLSCAGIKFTDRYAFSDKDDTEFLQKLLDGDSKKIVIPGNKTWITKPLFIRNKENVEIVFERGCTISAKAGEFHDPLDFLITLTDCKNVKLTGYGAALKMRKKDYVSRAYKYSQWRHGIVIFRCENTEIAGFRIQSTGGDGVYIGQRGKEQRACKNITLRDLTLEDNYRQGVSVISADGFLMENCVVFGTGGHLPKSGIDFEPNNEYEVFNNCIVRNCSFMFNKGSGIHIYLYYFNEKSAPVDITIENCISAHNLAAVSVMKAGKARGKITFINCDFKGLNYINVPKSLKIINQ